MTWIKHTIFNSSVDFFTLGKTSSKQLPPQIIAAYCAGIIDCLASFTVQFRKNKNSPFGRKLDIALVITVDKQSTIIFDCLKQILKVGSIKNNKDTSCTFSIRGLKSLQKILTLILPFVVIKKDLITDILSFLDSASTIKNEDELNTLIRLADKFEHKYKKPLKANKDTTEENTSNTEKNSQQTNSKVKKVRKKPKGKSTENDENKPLLSK